MVDLFERLFYRRAPGAKVSFTCVDETHGKAIIERDGEKHEVNILAFSKEKMEEIEEYNRKNIRHAA
jgi:hypothetical protein